MTFARINKIIAVTVFALSILGGSLAFAAETLESARAKGLIGETPSGYIVAVGNSDSSISSLVKSVNKERQAEYQRIAAKTNQSVDIIEKVAGQKLIEKSPSGSFVMDQSGKWVKK